MTSSVGIGTNNPTSKLEIYHNSYSVQSDIINIRKKGHETNDMPHNLIHLGTANPSHNSGAIKLFQNNITESILLSGNGVSYFNGGNVGIGSARPETNLQVEGGFHVKETSDGWNVFNSCGKGLFFRFYNYGNGNKGYIQCIDRSNSDTQYDLQYNALSYDFKTRTNNTDFSRLFITENGRVGIGTNSPAGALDVTSRWQ